MTFWEWTIVIIGLALGCMTGWWLEGVDWRRRHR